MHIETAILAALAVIAEHRPALLSDEGHLMHDRAEAVRLAEEQRMTDGVMAEQHYQAETAARSRRAHEQAAEREADAQREAEAQRVKALDPVMVVMHHRSGRTAEFDATNAYSMATAQSPMWGYSPWIDPSTPPPLPARIPQNPSRFQGLRA